MTKDTEIIKVIDVNSPLCLDLSRMSDMILMFMTLKWIFMGIKENKICLLELGIGMMDDRKVFYTLRYERTLYLDFIRFSGLSDFLISFGPK